MVTTLIFDAVAWGALVFSYLYLFTVRGLPWPPAGYEAVPWEGAAVAASLMALALGAGGVARRSIMKDRRASAAAAAVALGLLHTAAFVCLLQWMRPISATADAYGAVLWTLAGYALLHLAVVVLMVVYVLIAAGAGRLHGGRPLALQNTVLVGHFSAALTLGSLALIVFFPWVVGRG